MVSHCSFHSSVTLLPWAYFVLFFCVKESVWRGCADKVVQLESVSVQKREEKLEELQLLNQK